MKQLIELKGSGGGLVLQAAENLDVELFLRELQHLLEEGGSFFKGGRVIALTGVDYDYAKKAAIEALLKEHGLRVVSLEHPTRTSTKPRASRERKKVDPAPPKEAQEKPLCSDKTKLYRGTLRSGNRLDHHGDVVVFGDVNPGAEVVAEGNVIVLGKLRGVAHAGASGDVSAFIVAMDFRPTQLRIASTITRPPEETGDRERYPEIAYLDESGQILLEAVN